MANSRLENILKEANKHLKCPVIPTEPVELIWCQNHDKEYNMFCTQCNQLVCKECSKSEHRGHPKLVTDEIYESHRQEVQRKYEHLLNMLVDVGRDSKRLHDAKRKCLSEVTIKKGIVRKHGSSLNQKVEAAVDSIHNEIDHETQEVFWKFGEMENLKTQEFSRLERTAKYLNDVLQSGG